MSIEPWDEEWIREDERRLARIHRGQKLVEALVFIGVVSILILLVTIL